MEIDTIMGVTGAINVMKMTERHDTLHRGGTLQELPSEMLMAIFANEILVGRDLKAIRQSCRRFSPFVVPRLFETVGISKAWRDRRAFLNIASNPDLAKHVRRLVWYELRGTFANLNIFYDGVVCDGPDNLAPGPEPPECRMEMGNPPTVSWPTLSSDENAWRRRLVSEAMELFWWPVGSTMTGWNLNDSREEAEAWQNDHFGALDEFCPLFYEAILAMPGLTTFVSEQMPPSRNLQITDGGYPFTAGLFHDVASHMGTYDGNACQEILIPAIEQLELDGMTSPRILELHMDEDSIDLTRRRMRHLRPDNERITLRGLSRLHICWVRANPIFQLTEELPSILEAAPNLTHLRLCLDLVGSNMGHYPADSSFGNIYLRQLDPNPDFFGCLLQSFPLMPTLSSLYLDGVPFTSRGMCTFLERHAETLRHLHINVPPILEVPPMTWEAGCVIVDGRTIPVRLETFEVEFGGGCRTHRTEPSYDNISDSQAHAWDDTFLAGDVCFEADVKSFGDEDSLTVDRMTAGDSLVAEDDDERPTYAREHMSHLRHLMQHEQDTDELPAIWNFIHRNGEEAWGDEPLEYWSDWEGSEAGDTREPVPDEFVGPEMEARKDMPLTRSFFSKWDDGDIRCVRINRYWKEAIAGEPIVIEGTLPQHG